MTKEADKSGSRISRRRVLGYAGGITFALAEAAHGYPGGGPAQASSQAGAIVKIADDQQVLTGPPAKVRFAYNGTGVCSAAVPVALHRGYFAKHNLDVEFLALAGTTDQMLEALATSKAEVGISMLLSWLTRLLAAKESPYTDVTKLKGKTIGVTSLTGSPRHFFAVLLNNHGIDPDTEVQWKQFPAELLGTALDRDEVQAIADSDPSVWLTRQRSEGKLVEISSNLAEKYAHLSCCTLGVNGAFAHANPLVTAALTKAIREAANHVSTNPDDAAAVFAPYTPKVPVSDLAAMLRSHTHDHHPQGDTLRDEVAIIVADLKRAKIIRPATDPVKFAQKIVLDVSA
jgi:NitT/TauT family transport system substrate-binding protein